MVAELLIVMIHWACCSDWQRRSSMSGNPFREKVWRSSGPVTPQSIEPKRSLCSANTFRAVVTLELIALRWLNDVRCLIVIEARDLKQVVVRSRLSMPDATRLEHPGLGKHDGVLDGGLVSQHVPIAGPAFDHVLLAAMEDSVLQTAVASGKPGFVVEAGHVHYQRISLPMADRIAHIGGVQVIGMGAAIGVNDAIGGAIPADHGDHLRSLNDLHFAKR